MIIYCTEVPEVFEAADLVYVVSDGRLSDPLVVMNHRTSSRWRGRSPDWSGTARSPPPRRSPGPPPDLRSGGRRPVRSRVPAVTAAPPRRVVRTVLGTVEAADLGAVLMHEHLLIRNPSFVEPASSADRERAHAPVGLANLGWVRRHWTSSADNLVLDDEAIAIRELAAFVAAGGGTIVDATVPGIGRDPEALARISRAASVQIVMGSGAYVGPTHPLEIAELDEVAFADLLLREWHDGVGSTGIRPGFIGELGCFMAAGRSRAGRLARGGAGPACDRGRADGPPGPGSGSARRDRADPRDRWRLPGSRRHRPSRSNDQRSGRPPGARPDRASTSSSTALAWKWSFYPFDPTKATLSDAQRLDHVRALLDAGFGEQVLLSQDICTKHRLAAYGGHGYGHLLGEVLPWMWQRGFGRADDDDVGREQPGPPARRDRPSGV